MKSYEKAIMTIEKMLPALTNPSVIFTVNPVHGRDYAVDNESIIISAQYHFNDSRDLCDWLTNPAKVAGLKGYESMLHLPSPYSLDSVTAFLSQIAVWHAKAASEGSSENDVPSEIKSAWGGSRPGSGRPSTGRKRRQYYLTDQEDAEVKELVERLRGNL